MITWTSGPKAGTTEHAGRTVAIDIYRGGCHCGTWLALVMKDDGSFEEVEYAGDSDDYPAWRAGEAALDATTEVRAAYEALLVKREALARERAEEIERKRIARGRTLVVVKGRKVPIGTKGSCIYVGLGAWGERVGIKDASGTVHWTASSNVEVA